MTIRRIAFCTALVVGVCVVPLLARAEQEGATPEHIRTTQAFLMAWGNQRWDDLRAVAGDHVTVKVGSTVFTLEPAAHKCDVNLVFPFRGMSTLRADGKITGISIEDVGLKVADQETHGPAVITLQETNGQFRVTDVAIARVGQ